MAGSATFTSVVSRLTRNAASSSATRIMGLDRIVLLPEWVVSSPRPATPLWGLNKHTGVMAPVAPGWVSGIA
jgi:hypothetical protein